MAVSAVQIIQFLWIWGTLSFLLARYGAVVCDSRANLLDPTSVVCITNHVADVCTRASASALQNAFEMCTEQDFPAARFDVGQQRDMLVVARCRRDR